MTDIFTPLPTPPAWLRLRRLIVDHNPFYLLSAACMLLGCLLLTNSLSYSPIAHWRLIGLMATVNIYELLIVGLAVWLMAGRNQLRDGAFLLGIEALFMADVAMLNAELFTIDRRLGALVAALAMLLAAGKLALIFRALKIQSPSAYVLVLVHLAMILILPGAFKQSALHANGRLTPVILYTAWWAVGLLPILTSAVFREPVIGFDAIDLRPRRFGRIVGLFAWFAFGSLLLHLRLTNWVYSVTWQWANLSPVLLGASVAIGMKDHHVHTLESRMRVQLLLPILAIALSMKAMPELVGTWLAPMRLAFIGCLLVYLHGLWLHRHLYFGVACTLCLSCIAMGPTPGVAREHVMFAWNWHVDLLKRLIPRTGGDWGVLSVIASFLLLVAGAVVSVNKGKESGSPS